MFVIWLNFQQPQIFHITWVHLWHIQVKRIKELVTNDDFSWRLNKFFQLVLNKMYDDKYGEFV